MDQAELIRKYGRSNRDERQKILFGFGLREDELNGDDGLNDDAFNIERCEDYLKIEIPWFRGISAVYAVIVSIASLGLLGIGISFLIMLGFEVYVFIPAGLFFLLAFLLGLMSLGLIFNTTEIIVNKRELVVRHGPIPSTAANISLLISDIGRLSIDKKEARGGALGMGQVWIGEGTVVTTYHRLNVYDKSTDAQVSLIRGGRSRKEVLRIKSEIQSFIRLLK